MLVRLKSASWAVLEYLNYPLLLLATTPWFLQCLGAESFGVWMLLNATVGLGAILSAGTGAATIKEVSAAIGSHKTSQLEATIHAALGIALIGGGVLAIAVWAIFWGFGEHYFPTVSTHVDTAILGAAAAGLLWLEQIDNVFATALKGTEAFRKAAAVEIIARWTQMMAACVAVFLTPSLPVLFGTLLICATLRAVAKAWVVHRHFALRSVALDFSLSAVVFRFAKWGWLSGTGSAFYTVADRLIVGSLLGSEALAYYSVALQLTTQVHAICATATSVLFPLLSKKFSSDAGFIARRAIRAAAAASFALSIGLAIAILALGPTLLNLMLGTDQGTRTAALVPALVLSFWVLSLYVVPFYVLLAAGKAKLVGNTVLFAGLGAVVAAYFGVVFYGIAGACLGRLVYAVLSAPMLYECIRLTAGGRINTVNRQ